MSEEKIIMPIAETTQGRANKEEIEELQRKWLNKEISFIEYLESVRVRGGDVLYGEIRAAVPEGAKKDIQHLMNLYQDGRITIPQLQRIIAERGGEAIFWNWETERNPYQTGNKSKIGFSYNPYFSKKGKLLQHIIKPIVIKMINFAHKAIMKHYDKEALIYEDERLIQLNEYLYPFIDKHFSHRDYKLDFMKKIVDILLFLMKEDIFYLTRFLKLIEGLPREFKYSETEELYYNRKE